MSAKTGNGTESSPALCLPLEKREAEVLRSFYFEGCSWEETAKRIGVVLRSAYKIKNKAISHLTELYAFKTGLG